MVLAYIYPTVLKLGAALAKDDEEEATDKDTQSRRVRGSVSPEEERSQTSRPGYSSLPRCC
jgi:hypothetical protein